MEQSNISTVKLMNYTTPSNLFVYFYFMNSWWQNSTYIWWMNEIGWKKASFSTLYKVNTDKKK